MVIALSGATGFIGKRFQLMYPAPKHTFVVLGRRWAVETPKALDGCDAVVHLAGEPVAQRWNEEVKERIRSSRVDGTRQVVEAIAQCRQKPRVMVCASAVGFYGSRGSETLTEASAPGTGYLPEVCQGWEAAADGVLAFGLRLVKLRIAMVLGRGGGALATMETPFKLGVGGRLGSGQQWMSWIHLEDMVRLIQFSLENETISGVMNAVAPNPVTNEEFTAIYARTLHRLAIIPVPEFAIRLLFGEMASVIMASQRVLPNVARDSGFQFRFGELESAMKEIYG